MNFIVFGIENRPVDLQPKWLFYFYIKTIFLNRCVIFRSKVKGAQFWCNLDEIKRAGIPEILLELHDSFKFMSLWVGGIIFIRMNAIEILRIPKNLNPDPGKP